MPVGDFINRTLGCVTNNANLVEWGCELLARGNLTVHQGGGGYVMGSEDTQGLVTLMVVLDTLTATAVDDALVSCSATLVPPTASVFAAPA